MASNDLLIVESPTKARTIQRFIGNQFIVESSQGHIRDLPEKDNNAIDVAGGYTPRYVIVSGRDKIVKRLFERARESPTVWLATDEDREGEAIAWHLTEVLNLPQEKIKRIVFHEITRSAIERALQQPRGIDMNLVNAQQARRILDRLVGYDLSPLLWRKLPGAPSAGRVQSVAVRLIVEREREIESFVPVSHFRVRARFRTKADELVKAELTERISDIDSVRQLLSQLAGVRFTVGSVETKPSRRTPPAPFTTSTLQQEASRQIGLPIAQTMRLAQQLYESGYITYMRTDSVNLSQEAINAAGEAVKELFGREYHHRRQYQTKVANAQEAHEAIRPTDFFRRLIEEDNAQAQKLYELIWKRALASQMSDAQIQRTIMTIVPSQGDAQFIAEGEIVVFDGFLRLYTERNEEETSDDTEQNLPQLAMGDEVSLEQILARQTFTRPPARYTEATLVRKLEELGIGRPSTYATIVSRIQERGYVERRNKDGTLRTIRVIRLQDETILEDIETEVVGSERNKLFPTPIGVFVTDFLIEHFPDVMDYQFTASVEEQFDQIARGELDWRQMLDRFYTPFAQKVKSVTHAVPTARRRLLGKDSTTNENVYIGINRNKQPYIQRGDVFVTVPSNVSLDSLTLDQALYYLQIPRELGDFNDGKISIAVRERGPCLEWRSNTDVSERQFADIPVGIDPTSLTVEQAIALLASAQNLRRERQRYREPREIGTSPDGRLVIVAIGRYGPYVKVGEEIVSVPKQILDELTVEKALELVTEKQQIREQSILRRFEENPDAVIRQGKTKPYLQIGSKLYWLPDNCDYTRLSLEECLELATPARQRRRQSRRRA